MDSVLGRYRNLIALALVLSLQIVGLAVQLKRNADREPTRLFRIWTVSAITPLEKAIVDVQSRSRGWWLSYLDLRGVRRQNEDLKAQIEQLRLEQVRLNEDARQARRLQTLLSFKEQFVSQTLPAQVVGSSGSQQSRAVYIDRGQNDGVRPDMPVMTADGVVGKILRVYPSTSEVLLLNDQTSGVGAILENSRLQGVVRGTPASTVVLEKVMADETVRPGERVLTSGGDRIFPKGLTIGTVTKASPGAELFLNIQVKPAANLSRLEEVLVITKVDEKTPAPLEDGRVRAIDILAQRLPSVPPKPEASTKPAGQKPAAASSLKAAAPDTPADVRPMPGNPSTTEKQGHGTPAGTEEGAQQRPVGTPSIPITKPAAKAGVKTPDNSNDVETAPIRQRAIEPGNTSGQGTSPAPQPANPEKSPANDEPGPQ